MFDFLSPAWVDDLFRAYGLWAMFGTLLRNLLKQPTFLRVFNISMAVLLVLSLAPLVWH